MKIRTGLFACAALVALPHAAEAACYYNGVTYQVGAQICRNGWLEECTPASYWKAVGQCRQDDRNYSPPRLRLTEGLDRPLAPKSPALRAEAPVTR